jgi:energy-coupling factor transport system ATP-binding protein
VTPAILVQDLWYAYPNGLEVLKGINLSIDEGEFIAIMGENGAGKTTLVKHFNGLLKPTRGRVTVNGIDTRKATIAELSREVGYVFQNPLYQLFSETVESEVAMGPEAQRLPRVEVERRVNEALSALTISKYRERHPLMLSEGERKRVALAAVLSMEPKILILDEPSLGQDAAEKERLSSILRELHSQNRTVILVTHDVELAFDVVDRIIVMSKGEVLFDGPKRELLKKRGILLQASLVQPQIPLLASLLKPYGIPEDILTIQEAYEAILKLLRERGRV